MAEKVSAEGGGLKGKERRETARRITTAGWGLFFVWLGLVLLFKAGIGLILLGVGAISLGMQVVRRYAGLESDGFWVLVAIIFVVVGLWEIFEIRLPLVSLLLMLIGAAFFFSSFKGKTG